MRRIAFRPAGRALVVALALFTAALLGLTGLGERIDRSLDPWRAAASVHAPSGRLLVVEMDATSVAEIRRWPWPREHYAAVIDRLRRAGAASITFDVDLSTPSTRAGDAAMARALARTDGIVALPTFAQAAGTRAGDTRRIDALPLPAFRPHVALASVSMQPDTDGIVRRAPLGTVTADTPRPSLSAYIAHRSGAADQFFPLDAGIDHRLLPRLSFVAVEHGRFDPAVVRGRDVLIGATAIEMGDRYAIPHWGVVPGVIVQALAVESLFPGVPTEGDATLAVLLALLLAAPVLLLRSPRGAAVAAIAAPIALFAAAVWARGALLTAYPLGSALGFLVVVAIGRAALHLRARFERQRCFDEATGLPNRAALVRDLDQHSPVPLLAATLGNYDALLTLLGQRAGDDLVLRIADRLRLAGGGTVYRLGDRRLAVELATAADDWDEYFASLRAVLTQPVELLGRRTDAAVHLGLSGADGAVHDRLVEACRAADEAAATGTFWRHGSVDAEALERRLVLMGELDHAIAAGQIEVHYQPKLSLHDDRISSVEALVRWRHPERGMVRPDLFIPLAEQSDRIATLTLFVLEQVITDLARWRSGGLDLTAAVNLSAMLIAEPDFAAAVDRILNRRLVPPATLIFEVTESATLADPLQAAANLGRYRQRGIAVSMDDYGTGQSTLTYLRQLPLSELKIDRSFVQHAHVNRSDGLMVRSTIELAHDLGLKVVAEGIEDEGCLAFLRDAGCDMAQGYLIGRPLPASDLVAMLRGRALAA
ncbi:putative bifunctional diguanylate cyclase/phosphodiesterase [Sphingomonas rubra]|uniref:EAL domain, c-di-GMP-specific phosphodiesterase class I (Or its enzymatically inactive variant) n=1 Tax=Sphingomonas rubra TaxID=634430 RepID=A0A1I5RI29_9SPHN|nr:EAL domain-containing protein [Sphingomonas rubra]SFP57941.1 EAL domain, c-di-GMP-specific phosphodiesterase class I (or its enzymatically inactive variant) [Sphingomonas rubra]